MTAPAPPLDRGSISVGLHPEPGLGGPGAAGRVVGALVRQAQAAEAAGFDGVTLSEHHGGFPGYLPVPVLMAGRLLAALERSWVAACPTILPLWDVPILVEELAWLSACWPGRLGLGVVPGYQERDFEIAGRDFDDRLARFSCELPRLTAALRGQAPPGLGDDPAVAALAASPVPVVSGVGGPRRARAAAEAGAGILLTSLTPPARAGELSRIYREAGGSGPVVLIRRVWLGRIPKGAAEQVERYRASGLPDAPGPTDVLAETAAGDGEAVAERIVSDLARSGADSVNLRFFGDVPGEVVEEQLARSGSELLPLLRSAGSSVSARAVVL
jgi:alkanesulfonate monooxygenase SsuD/methylene tetrahydromethanopterin reductase-like flavin-dependent oxidoreductase (luciferase family)